VRPVSLKRGLRQVLCSLASALAIAGFANSGATATLEFIQGTKNFNICANPEALPYSSETGLPGFQLEVHKEISKRLGWNPTVSWVYNRIAARRVDCGGSMGRMLYTNQEVSRIIRGTKAYMGSGSVIVLPPRAQTDFDSLASILKGPAFSGGGKMGIYLGAWTGGLIEKQGVLTTGFPDAGQIIEAVLAGAVSGGVVPREDAAWQLKQHPGSISIIEIFKFDPEFRWNLGMGMRKSDQNLIDKLNETLAQMQRDGTFMSILDKYGISYQPPFPDIAD
jgi:ABC-type amino acid transport substrate-binding protein